MLQAYLSVGLLVLQYILGNVAMGFLVWWCDVVFSVGGCGPRRWSKIVGVERGLIRRGRGGSCNIEFSEEEGQLLAGISNGMLEGKIRFTSQGAFCLTVRTGGSR